VKDWIAGRRIDEAVDLLMSLAMGRGAAVNVGGSIVASQPITVVVGDVTTRPTVTFEEARRRLVQEHGVGVQVGITAGGSIGSSLMALYDRFFDDFEFESCECEDVEGGVLWRVKNMITDDLDPVADVVITLYRTGKATTGGKETPQLAAVSRWLEEQGFSCWRTGGR